MKIIDLHQDLMTHIRFKDVLKQNEQTGFELLTASPVDTVVATAFPFPENDNQLDQSVHDLITEELEMYQKFVAKREDWTLITQGADFDDVRKKLLLHIEGLNIFVGSDAHWKQLDAWRDLGVRSVGTHWNVDNALGGGTNSPMIGLTALGAEVVAYLENNSMVFDMAHMSRQGFFDVAKIVNRPLYVSHGNADALCQSVRNYTNKQLEMIAESGGVIGVFFPNTFVAGKGREGTITDVVSHIRYIADLIGDDHVALGSDFGGIVSGCVAGLGSVRDFSRLTEHLYRANFTEVAIEKILYLNGKRILKAHLL